MINRKFKIFAPFRGRKFTEGDAFIGYQKDTPAAVVFQATHQLEREGPAVSPQGRKRTEPVSIFRARAEEEEDSHVWKENVGSLGGRLVSVSLPCVSTVILSF